MCVRYMVPGVVFCGSGLRKRKGDEHHEEQQENQRSCDRPGGFGAGGSDRRGRLVCPAAGRRDESSKEFAIRTDAEYLGDALLECGEMGVVGEDGAYGLYIKEVDGEKASDDDHTFWSIALNGEDLMVGADSQPINDGESYTLTLATW